MPPGAHPLARPPSRTTLAGGTSPTTLVGTVITLAFGLVVAIACWRPVTSPVTTSARQGFLVNVFTLAVLAGPLALLVSWDEYDLSVIGGATLGGIVYARRRRRPGSAILPGVVAAVSVGGMAVRHRPRAVGHRRPLGARDAGRPAP